MERIKKQNTLVLKAVDTEAREVLLTLEAKINTINERTKKHTLDIRELRNIQKSIQKKE